ncbi:Hypothetical predicted protein [Octopus vulgaris]|uniref:Mini-chromosome maintenance complex-binding protein n=1 Tax=Octopus vulgaris TaxID=6645 RepID=A0AA36BL65_OCTVU|nr:Hypothetical predicted protein [Octopus vulgaris]
MPGLFDYVNQPLQIIQKLFDQQSSLKPESVSDYFRKELEKPSLAAQVKSVNSTALHDLIPNSLVRYRCMVQDMFDPEFYMGTYKIKDSCTKQTFVKCGMYRDVAECKPEEIITDSNQIVMLDRQTLYCIPIPAETQWLLVLNSFQGYAEKENTVSSELSASASGSLKRPHDDVDDAEDMECTNTHDTEMNPEDKRSRQNISEGQISTTSPLDLNFPLPGETGPACLVKIYDKIETLKVNDMLEVIGILSIDPSMVADSSDFSGDIEEGMSSTAVEQHLPPPSLVPRIHAVMVNKVNHNNPWLTNSLDKDSQEKILAEVGEDLKTLRRRLLELLQQVTLGDSLAAEYLLCHLISSIYFSSGLLPVGKLSLNLSRVPTSLGYAKLLHQFISSLVTKCYMLPLSLSYLNSKLFSPQKDYSKNRLKTGVLQMSKQTHFILDETQLEAGQLNVEGHKNIKALENVIRFQKIEYDFGFYQREYESNIEVLCISEGKSILPADVHIPLDISIRYEDLDSYFSRVNNELTPNLVKKFQIYLGLVKMMEYTLNKEFEQYVQNDFISMRKNDSKSITEDGLHSLLNLTRLLTMSWGLPGPTTEVWQRAKVLETSRRERVQQQTPTPQPH